MYDYNKDTNKNLLYFYIALIAIMIITNIVGNIYIDFKSEKEEKLIRTSLEKYENMDPVEADETVERELNTILSNAKKYVHNIGLEICVTSIIVIIATVIEIFKDEIVKIAEADYTHSEYSGLILGISRIVALICIVFDIKDVFSEIVKYRHLLSYYEDIYDSLFGLIANIQKQIIN